MSSSSVRVLLPSPLAAHCLLSVSGRPASVGVDILAEPGEHVVELRSRLVISGQVVSVEYETTAIVPPGGTVTVAPTAGFEPLLGASGRCPSRERQPVPVS